MTLNPETQIVASGYDAARHVHTYTVEHGGKRWTARITDTEFEQFGPALGATAASAKQARRAYLARKMREAMDGPADK